MKKLKFSKEEYSLAKYIIILIHMFLIKAHPKLLKVDSNLFHIIVYEVSEKLNLPIARSWFKNGMYCPVVDDILIEMGMDKSQHQMYGNEIPMENIIECGCHERATKED